MIEPAIEPATKPIQQPSPQAPGLGRKLVASTFTNFAGQLVLMAATFLWTPYIVRNFGDALYGVFVLLMTYVAVFTLLELGINSSLVKHLAETIPQKRLEDVNSYLGTAMALFSGTAVVVALISAIGAPYIVRLALNVPSQYFEVAVLGVRIASVAFALQFISQGFASVPIATHRFDVMNGIQVGTEILRMALTAAAVFAGYRLTAVMLITLLTSSLRLLAFAIAASKLVPGISLRPRFSTKHLSHILHFSKYIFISKVSSTAVWSADKLFIGHFLPIQFVAFYSIPFQLSQRVWALAGNVTTVVFPAASELSMEASKARLHNLYLRSNKMVTAILMAPALLLFVFSSQILTYWINPLFAERGAWPLRLLALGFMLNGLTVVPALVAAAVNRPNIQAAFAVANSTANIALFLMLIPRYGTTGAAAAFFITQAVQWPWYMHTVNRLIGMNSSILLKKVYGRIAIPSICTFVLAFALRSMVHSLLSLLVCLTAIVLANLVLLFFFALDGDERGTCFQVANSWIPCRARELFSTGGGA